MAKLSDTTLTETKDRGEKSKGVKLGAVAQDRTSLPEYIKAEVLQGIFPFTIFYADKSKGRFGDRIKFHVAYKLTGGAQEKKVLTLSENDERKDLMYNVLRHKFITNCRLIQIQLGGNQTYWKIIDNDEPIPENVEIGEPQIADEDIPF